MAYYSFVVEAPQPLGIPKPMLLLDQGMNVFTIEVDDVEGLLQKFKDEGVIVKQANRLDDHEPGQASDLLLEGEVSGES